jgi:hypothetical protein
MKTIIALLAFASPAHAVDMLPLYDNAPKVERVSAPAKAKPKAKKATKARSKPKPAYSFRPPPVPTESVTRCLGAVRVVGSQDVREQAAEDSAKRAWAELVRWTYGESFQDFALAQGYAKRCSRSSIGEALGQYFTRCEIEARPCRPGMIEGAK